MAMIGATWGTPGIFPSQKMISHAKDLDTGGILLTLSLPALLPSLAAAIRWFLQKENYTPNLPEPTYAATHVVRSIYFINLMNFPRSGTNGKYILHTGS